jgi:hypothetical protein
MTTADHEAQAQQFLAWHSRRGGALEDDFGAWARSKGFLARDLRAIRNIVIEEVAAYGTVQTIDPFARLGLFGKGAA